MSRVYDSLFQQMQARLHSARMATSHGVRLKDAEAANIKDELDEFQKNVIIHIDRFKNAITTGENLVDTERREAEQLIESLRNENSALQEDLKAAGEGVTREQGRARELETSLTVQIQELKDNKERELEAQEKQHALASREKIDAQVAEIRELQYVLEESKLEVAGYVKRIEALTETFTARIADLEHRILVAEKTVADRESEAQLAHDRLSACTEKFEREAEQKDALLKTREAEVKQLQTQLWKLTRGIKEMSSFFTQVDALETVDSRQLIESVKEPDRPEPNSDHSWLVSPTAATATLDVTDSMPAEFFKELTDGLTEAVGPIATVIIGDQLEHLGGSVEHFPRGRVTELLDLLIEEITQPAAKAQFRARFSKYERRVKDAAGMNSAQRNGDSLADASSEKAE